MMRSVPIRQPQLQPERQAQRGFTLIEVLLAMGLLAAVLSLLFGAFRFAGQAWEAGESRAVTASNVRHAQMFMRREMERAFAQRWREQGAQTARIAFEGEEQSIKFMVPRAGGSRSSGLVAVSFALLDESNFERRQKRLVVQRETLDSSSTDFDKLGQAEPRALLENVASVSFEYFGTANDKDDPTWRGNWEPKQRLPQLVKVKIELEGTNYVPPELVVPLVVGEESGCYINAFQRQCGAIR
jgi:general secretion pathway protein J